MTQHCNGCGKDKDLAEFSRDASTPNGHRYKCKECCNAGRRTWYAEDPTRTLEANRRWRECNRQRLRDLQRRYYQRNRDAIQARARDQKFGLALGEYDAILEQQGGVCAICSQPPNGQSLAVDHDHATGDVRGLLCGNCNLGLGKFGDEPARLIRAIDYLETTNRWREAVA